MRTVRACVGLALLAGIFLGGGSLSAQQISPNNPFRSFNIHGINYGSMRWEQEQAAKRGAQPQAHPVMRVRRRFR